MGCSHGSCDGNDKLPYTCNRCGQTFCSDHRLPEAHQCTQPAGASTSASSTRVPQWVTLVAVLAVVIVPVGYAAANPGVVSGFSSPDFGDALSDDSLNEENVSQMVFKRTNDLRNGQREPGLQWNDQLAQVARDHSQNMGERGELSHRGARNDDVNDRLSGHGHQCAGSAGENVAKTWYEVDIEGGERYDTPEDLAAGIVSQFAESDAHRENMLRDWSEMGVGISVVEEDGHTAIYVTQVFC